MRKYGRVDLGQEETVRQLRQIGASVEVASSLGNGFVDLVVGYRGRNILLELKTDEEPLTAAEKRWHEKWAGQASIVRSTEAALRVVIDEAMGI